MTSSDYWIQARRHGTAYYCGQRGFNERADAEIWMGKYHPTELGAARAAWDAAEANPSLQRKSTW